MPSGVYERTEEHRRIKLTCQYCGERFEGYKNQKYCSIQCYWKSLRRKKIKLICKCCKKEFEVYPSTKNRKYCSIQCFGESRRGKKERVKLICRQCGKEFETYPNDRNRKYCSIQCFGLSERGVKLGPYSEESRKNLSKAVKKRFEDPKEREKMRIVWEKRVENSDYPKNYFKPNFNFESISIFRALDKVLHTKGRYGGIKAGEKKIGRYFVDYFSKKYQLIIEWNEDEHYDNGNLKEYDIKKREYVLIKCPNYLYVTIRQDKWFKKDSLTKVILFKIVNHILEELKEKTIGIEK